MPQTAFAADSDAELSSITLDGETITGFDPGILTYDINVSWSTEQIDIGATPVEQMAAVSGELGTYSLSYGLNIFTITCDSVDGVNHLAYTLNITRDAAGTDATLSDLTVGGVIVEGFSPVIYAYGITVAHSATPIEIGATAADENAAIDGIGAKELAVGLNTFVVTCTAEDTETSQSYTLNITRLPDTDAALSDITIDGNTLASFSSGTYSYDYTVGYSKGQIDIGVAANDPQAQVTGDTGTKSLDVGLNTFTVTCTAEDGTTKHDYTLDITRSAAGTNASLSDLTIDGAMITGFSGAVVTYDITVDNLTEQVTIGATPADNNARVAGVGTKPLSVGINTFIITCTAEDGGWRNYALNITRLPEGTVAGKVAILFGMADYVGTVNDLPGPVNDMIGLQAVLEHAGYTVHKYMNYTASNLLSTVQTEAASMSPEGTLLFAYSGHGANGGFLVGADGNGVSISDLETRLSYHSGVKEVLIDACFSGDFIGRSIESESLVRTDSPEEFNDYVISVFQNSDSTQKTRNLVESGYYVITAATGSQYSNEYAFPGSMFAGSPFGINNLAASVVDGQTCYWLGYFNLALHDGFGLYDDPIFSILWADDNSDNMITWSELYEYIAHWTNDAQQAQVYPSNSSHLLYNANKVSGPDLQSSAYTINRAGSMVGGVDDRTSLAGFKGNFTNDSSQVKVYRPDNSQVASGYVGTGMKARLVINNIMEDQLQICIMGDVSGDGIIDINDILFVRSYILGTYSVQDAAAMAAEVSGDGVINITDILYMRSHILGTYDINAYN